MISDLKGTFGELVKGNELTRRLRYHKDGKIKIIFVKSADNDSDICTKKLGDNLFDKHSKKLIKKYE